MSDDVFPSLFGSMYQPYDKERSVFGEHWCGPEQYQHMKYVLCASYKAVEGGDGQDVDVYCCAMPARFYTIIGKPGVNSVGEPVPAWEFGTGSSAAQLAADMAKAASEGMLGFHPVSRVTKEQSGCNLSRVFTNVEVMQMVRVED